MKSRASDTSTQLDSQANESGKFAQFVGQSEKLVGKVAASLESASRRTSELSERLGTVDLTLRKLDTLANKTAVVSEQIRMLSINARLEAARAGTARGGFSAVATAVAELSADFGSLAHEIRDGIIASRATVAEIVGCAKAAAKSDAQTVSEARKEIVQLQANTTALSGELSDSLQKVQAIGKLIQSGFSRCIRGLQFDDMVRQIGVIARQRVAACKSFLSSASDFPDSMGSSETPCSAAKHRLAVLAAAPPRSIQQTNVEAGEVEMF